MVSAELDPAQYEFGMYRDIRQWVWVLVSPFALATVLKIFPLDAEIALLAVLTVLMFSACASILVVRNKRGASFITAGAALLTCASLPFWDMISGAGKVRTPPAPVYSFKMANGNPDAFVRWWHFYVEQVVHVNSVIHMPDPLGTLPHVLQPGASSDFYKGRVRINSLGYRGNEFSREKGTTFRIVALGHSATFGQTIFSDGQPWPAVLDHLLQRRLSCTRPLQVINGGVNAYTLSHGIERLERDLSWLEPDMVLSYFGMNTPAEMNLSSRFPFAHSAQSNLPPATSDRAKRVMWYLGESFRSLSVGAKAAAVGLAAVLRRDRIEEIMAEVRRGPLYKDYKRFMKLAAEQHFQLVFLSFNTAVSPESPEEAIRFYEKMIAAVRPTIEIVRIQNIMLAELAHSNSDVFFADTSRSLYGRYNDDLFIDTVHFTTSGDALMAENVYREIEPLLTRNPALACVPR
jgi:lysophospholipase L1-like esterase